MRRTVRHVAAHPGVLVDYLRPGDPQASRYRLSREGSPIFSVICGPRGMSVGGFPWHRQLALIYLLIGAVATALGTIQAPSGWFWSTCFLLIFGGLAASVCLTIDIVASRAMARPNDPAHAQEGPSPTKRPVEASDRC